MTLSFAETIRIRLLLLIELAGTTPTTLSRRMTSPGGQPRAHSYLIRKLGRANGPDASEPTRDLTTAEADEVLAALGLEPRALLEPVFGTTDLPILRWLANVEGVGAATEAELTGLFAEAFVALRRLQLQGFITSNATGDVSLTDLGRSIARA